MALSDSFVHYCDQANNIRQFRSTAVPTNLQAKFMLLTFFANYMEKHLLKVWLGVHCVHLGPLFLRCFSLIRSTND